MKVFVSVLALVAIVGAGPVVQESETVLKSVIGNFVNCMNSDLSLCLKEKALLVTERVGSLRNLKLMDGLTIINNAPQKEARMLETLSTDPEIRSREVSEKLAERTARLLENTDIEISFGTDDDEGRSIGEARDKKKKEVKKKIKMLLPLLAILKIKALIAITLSVIVIAAALAKIALLAKLAFIAKAIFIIKKLIAKHHEHHEEAWVPHHEEHHGHGWDGGWSRSRNEANNLAYSAYNQS